MREALVKDRPKIRGYSAKAKFHFVQLSGQRWTEALAFKVPRPQQSEISNLHVVLTVIYPVSHTHDTVNSQQCGQLSSMHVLNTTKMHEKTLKDMKTCDVKDFLIN